MEGLNAYGGRTEEEKGGMRGRGECMGRAEEGGGRRKEGE